MRKLIFLVSLLLGGFPGPAMSQGAYPSKPVLFIVTSPDGATINVLAETLASSFARQLRQANDLRIYPPGASSRAGVERARNAPADGYTILISSDNAAALPTGFSPVVLLARGAGNSQVFGMYLPAGSAKDVVDRLNAMVNAILKMPDIVQKVAMQGLQVGGGTPADLARVALVEGNESKKGEIATLPTRGVLMFGGRARYEGDLVHGKPHGKGVMTFPSGARYEGEFVGNKYQGKGIYTSPNGQRYEGDHVAGARQGKGVLTWPNGQRYEGDFMNGKYSGYGVMTLSDGTRYAGNWLNGERTGQTQQTSQAVHAESRVVDASVASSVGGGAPGNLVEAASAIPTEDTGRMAGAANNVSEAATKQQVWPVPESAVITKTERRRIPWRDLPLENGRPPITGPETLEYVSSPDGWQGMRWKVADRLIIVMPTAETVRRFAVDCGPINVQWAGNFQPAERAVLASGRCVNNVPDGEVHLIGADGRTQLSVTYQNGQPVGPMVYKRIESWSDFGSVKAFVLATGTATTVMRNGMAWLEFGKLDSYLTANPSISTLFTGGQTQYFLQSGSGKCSRQVPAKYDNGFESTLREFEPCKYDAVAVNKNSVYTSRTDAAQQVREAATDARLAALDAEQAERDKVVNAEMAERMRRIEQVQREMSSSDSSAAIGVHILQRGAENAALLNRVDRQTIAALDESNRVRAAQAAARDRARAEREEREAERRREAEHRREAERERATREAAERSTRATVVASAPELPQYKTPVVTIPKGRETCPPGSSPARQANGQYVTIPPAAYCIKDAQSASGSGSNSSSTSGSDRPLSASTTTTRPPTSGSSGGNTGSDAPGSPTTVKQPPKTEWGPIQLEAFAICRQSEKNGKWWCDGPGQDLILVDSPTVEAALDSVGCSPATSAAGARTKDGKSAELYRCGYGLRSYDRNIAKIHGVVTAPRSYMCPKYHSAKCTDFYNGQDRR